MKTLKLLILITIGTFLFGCDQETTTANGLETTHQQINTTTKPFITTTLLENTGQTFTQDSLTYYTWSHDGRTLTDEKYASIAFIDPVYTPISGEVCFSLDISDADYKTSEYYIVNRKRGTSLTESQISFTIDASSKQLYHCQGYDPADEIVIGKTNSKDLNPSPVMDVLALLTVDDPYMNDRLNIEAMTIYEHQSVNFEDPILSDTEYVDMYLSLNDPNRVVTSLTFDLYYRAFDLVYQTLEIELTESMFVDDVLELEHLIIDQLPPDCAFELHIFISGFDGVTTFDKVKLTTRNVTSSTYHTTSYINESMPGLWGMIQRIDIQEDTTTVYFFLENNGNVTYQQEPVHINLIILSDNATGNQLIDTIPISEDMSSVEIDNELLKENYALRIVVEENDLILNTYNINFGFYQLMNFSYRNQTANIIINPYTANIISIYVSYSTSENGTPFFETTFEAPESGTYAFDVLDGPTTNSLYIHMMITYRGFNGIETFELFPSQVYG